MLTLDSKTVGKGAKMSNEEDKVLAKKLGFDTLVPVDEQKTKVIVENIKQQRLTKQELEHIIAIAPHVVDAAKDYFRSAVEIAKLSSASQIAVLDGISKIIDHLGELGRKAKTDATISKIADYLLQIAKMLKDINDSNNSSWGKVLAITGVIGTAIVAGLLGLKN